MSGVQSGGLITNGSYSLPVNVGLPPGEYLVRVFSSPPNQPDESDGSETMLGSRGKRSAVFVDPVPPQYNVKSELFIEVTEDGPSQFDFSIKTK
jgi:hypothetical protein